MYVSAYRKLWSKDTAGVTERSQENIQSGMPLSRPKFEKDTSQICKSIKARVWNRHLAGRV
jgi:hypothetical protein